MTTRILPPAEWPKLAGTEAETVWPTLHHDRSAIVVVEDGATIVACHVLMYVLHAECLWVHPDHRGKSSAARRLWDAVKAVTREMGVPALVTAACDDRVRGLLAHVGATQLPGDHYVVPVGG